MTKKVDFLSLLEVNVYCSNIGGLKTGRVNVSAAKALREGATREAAKGSERPAAIHEEVYQRLRQAIMAGQLEPGRSLSVRGLAAEFGVSAMPAREAIRHLAALGALEFTPTRRVAVARMTKEKLSEIRDARLALEPPLGIRFLRKTLDDAPAREAVADRLAEIEDRLGDAIAQGDSAAYARINCEFHFALYEAADAPVHLALIESLWLQTGPFMRVLIGRRGTSAIIDQHKDAIEAIRAVDGEKLRDAIRDNIKEGMSDIARSDFQ